MELGGELRWNSVDLGSRDKGIVQKTSAIFCHAAIGSLATSALAALLNIYTRPPPVFLFPFLSLAFIFLLLDYQLYRLACYGPYRKSVTTTWASRDCQPADRGSVRIAKMGIRDERGESCKQT